MTRQKYNLLIVEKLKELIHKYPDLRFGQILVNSEVIQLEEVLLEGERQTVLKGIDPFYEEPEFTWERMKNNKFAFKELFN
jgi:hypothetical protein